MLTEVNLRIIDKHLPAHRHPFRSFEDELTKEIRPTDIVLEIGCGRTAPLLVKFKARAQKLIGIELEPFVITDRDLHLLNCSVSAMPGVPNASVDIAYSRGVMEHVADIDGAYAEISRVLRPGGVYHFLTPNLWDYSTLIANIVPNRFHGWIVRKTEGRDEEDTFPTFYRSNTRFAISKLAKAHGLEVDEFSYLGQYPSYLLFNNFLFDIGCRYEKFLESNNRLHFLMGWILCRLRKPAR